MGRASLWAVGIGALALVACETQRGGLESDGQSHWLHACQSSSQCGGDAQCLCGICSRGCSGSGECGGGQCVETTALGDACSAQDAPARICVAPVAMPAPNDASRPMVDAAVPRAGASSVALPDGGSAGARALDAAVSVGDAAMPFDAGVCETFRSAATPSRTTVRLLNGTNQQLYLGSTTPDACGELFRFSLETADGMPVVGQVGHCAFSCEQIQRGQCSCTPDCPFLAVISLMPNESFEVEWLGTLFTSQVMPNGCYPAQSCTVGIPCTVERTVDQPLIVKALAYPEVSCGEAATCMPCQQNGGGSCVVFDAKNVKGTPRMGLASWEPGQAMVTITF